ncbi:MAG TPA: DUF3793 family protein [Terriglobales bacterium]|nr:DUF3793 family protein [Terriglobales bacterium]
MTDTRCHDCRAQLDKTFLVSAAPVLAGVKPSALVCVRHCFKEEWRAQKAHFCAQTGLTVKELYENKAASGWLIYDEPLLSERLQSAAARAMLRKYGYPADGTAADLLEHLKGRFDGAGFPHEIGVFLGYPPRDVEAFIARGGRDYLCCRYWKVYHDEEGARETFGLIDRARAQAAKLAAQQVPVCEAAKILARLQLA